MRGERSTTFTDGGGRRWRVRELVRPDAAAAVTPDRAPALTRATLVFESRGERRFANDAPLNWRDHRPLLGDLFARATPHAVAATQGGSTPE
jgi:hypothetical protein